MHALVLGTGVSGKSAAAFLRRRGWSVVHEGEPEGFDLVIVSPGIPNPPPGAIGELELGLRELKGPAVGITGTNGKTTTTMAVAHVLNACGHPAKAVGNIGVPLTEEFEGINVIEMSSAQLETAQTRALDGAAILNITPDHLDRYATFEEYAVTKWRIAELRKPGAPLHLGPGAVEALVGIFGVTPQECTEAMKSFEKPPHRCEFVAEIDGVRYINDSKGTNVASVQHALNCMEGPILLIAGGLAKGQSLAGLQAHRIFAIGEAMEQLQRECDNVIPCGTLERAVREAQVRAEPGMTVLLSPGCASFDQFENFEERGNVFKVLVKSLTSGNNESRDDESARHNFNCGVDQCRAPRHSICNSNDG